MRIFAGVVRVTLTVAVFGRRLLRFRLRTRRSRIKQMETWTPDEIRAQARVLRLVLAADQDDGCAFEYAVDELCCEACAARTMWSLAKMVAALLDDQPGDWRADLMRTLLAFLARLESAPK